MGWARFDDNAPEDPRVDGMSDGAFRLWFNAICYSNRNLTDGYVPNARIPRLTPRYKPAHKAELIDAGAWHKEQDGIRIHGYLDYQPSAAQVHEQRQYEREKKAQQRAKGANTPRATNGKYKRDDTTIDDDAQREAERRYQQRATSGAAIVDPQAWIHTTAQRLRDEGYEAPPPALPVRCDTCKDVVLAEPCPDCT